MKNMENSIIDDPPEFTDEELHRVLKQVGETARREAFAAGLPVAIFKNGMVILQYADGREEIADRVQNGTSQSVCK